MLRDDGVIFISVDDGEVDNLLKLSKEIFGEENFIASIAVVSNPRGRQSDRYVATVHDYMLILAKNIDASEIGGAPLTKDQAAEFSLRDSNGDYYRLLGLRQRGSASRREDRPDMFFPIYVKPSDLSISITPVDGFVPIYPKKSDGTEGRWMWGKQKCIRDKELLVSRLIERRDEYDIFVKDYLSKYPPAKPEALVREPLKAA